MYDILGDKHSSRSASSILVVCNKQGKNINILSDNLRLTQGLICPHTGDMELQWGSRRTLLFVKAINVHNSETIPPCMEPSIGSCYSMISSNFFYFTNVGKNMELKTTRLQNRKSLSPNLTEIAKIKPCINLSRHLN